MNKFYTGLLLVAAMLMGVSSAYSQCTNLFFSEYIEGSSNNKAVEIFNPTANAVDLSGYSVTVFSNGSTNPGNQLTWQPGTMIASGDVYVIANSNADSATILSVSDTTSNITFYNGDDALVLRDTILGEDIDIIGIVGNDPGTEWPVGTGSTKEHTLVRKSSVNDGQTNWAIAVLGWESFDQNFTDSLGFHNINSCEATANPIASYEISGSNAPENSGSVTVNITLSEIDMSYILNLTILDTSTAGVTDYAVLGGLVLQIEAGDTLISFQIDILDDMDVEANETVVLQLSEATGGVTIGTDEYTLTILDDDNPPTAPCEYPFFSEYIEGSSNNKAIEIFNPTDAAIDMSLFRINRYNNGLSSDLDTSGRYEWPSGTMLGSMEVYVIANASADSVILAQADTTHSITFFNGDDALQLEHIPSGMALDVIGNIGEDPGSGWPVDAGATNNTTIIRNADVNGGQTNWFLAAMTWTSYPNNFTDSLGTHTMEPCEAFDPCDTTDIVINATLTHESVDGADDGAIDLDVSGGDTNYSYVWSNGETSEDISGLADGEYCVVVTDGNGCASDICFNILPGEGPCDTVTIIITGVETDESSLGENDGAIDITVSGGTPPYTFDWSNNAETEDISDLAPGNYTVFVRDANGCTADATFEILAGPDPCQGVTISIVVNETDESSAGANDGAVDITVSGGTPPYSYDWSNSAVTEDISGVAGGNYTVTVTDANGCTGDANASVGTGTAVNEIAELKIFNVYPNPAVDRFQVELQFEKTLEVQLQIVDVAGRIVAEFAPEQTNYRIYTIDATWPSGIYFLKIRAENDLAVEPIMISK